MHPQALRNCDQPLIDPRKFTEYALSPTSPQGRHKARVFERALGFNLSNWMQLEQAIRDALCDHPARLARVELVGIKYIVVIPVTGPNGRTADVLTVWIYDAQADGSVSDHPRLVMLRVG